jgi:hypothetical protein
VRPSCACARRAPIDDDVLRRLERELDLEERRMDA